MLTLFLKKMGSQIFRYSEGLVLRRQGNFPGFEPLDFRFWKTVGAKVFDAKPRSVRALVETVETICAEITSKVKNKLKRAWRRIFPAHIVNIS